MYSTCVSSKLCEFILYRFLFTFCSGKPMPMFKQRGEQKGDKPGKFAENLVNAKIKASLNLQLSAKNGNTYVQNSTNLAHNYPF